MKKGTSTITKQKQINCKTLRVALLLLFSLFMFQTIHAADNTLQKQARTLINLLDYVSQDYMKAVSNGKVINANEYNEMIDFTTLVISLFDSLALHTQVQSKEAISKQLSQLLMLIKSKEDKNLIAAGAQQIKMQIILLRLIDIYPEQYPDITEGKKHFLANCQSCHGITGEGNGPLSVSFTPRPTNFSDNSLMQLISPLQVFNTARLGVQGTGMKAFDELSDKQLWQIAFYIKSLPFEKNCSVSNDSLEIIFRKIEQTISLSDISLLSDKELKEKMQGNNNELSITAIRLHYSTKNGNNSLNIALNYLDDALNFYKNNNASGAEEKALYAYLNGIEPLEQQLAAIDANIVPELENKMNEVRFAIKSGKSISEVEQVILEAKTSIAKASQLLSEQTYSFWFSFLIAASILLREGLEALLIIITILSLLQSLQAKKAIRWVHGGWVTALVIGAASWFFTGWLISLGSQNREIIEGIGSVVAVIILVYVGFWLHNKTEAKKWQQFVHTRITALLDQEKMFGLASISFIVVFREAFESILFLSSMKMQVDENSRNGIWMGALAAIIAVIVFSHFLLRFAIRIPVRTLFQYSAIIIMILAVVLTGQGVHALQESGWIAVTNIHFNFRSGILGIFPTAQTYIAQVVMIVITIILWQRGKNSLVGKKEILNN